MAILNPFALNAVIKKLPTKSRIFLNNQPSLTQGEHDHENQQINRVRHHQIFAPSWTNGERHFPPGKVGFFDNNESMVFMGYSAKQESFLTTFPLTVRKLKPLTQRKRIMNSQLNLHSGGELVTLDQVRQVVTPKATDTWTPIAHDELVDSVRETMSGNGLQVVNESHALWQDGNRYFGLFQLQGDKPDYSLVVGLRNSHDKTFPAGLVTGSRVFVCSNLAFNGEVKLSRRHTPRIRQDLPRLINLAVGKLGSLHLSLEQRIEAYKNFNLDDFKAHDLLIRAVDAKACPVTRIPYVLKEWRNPSHEEFAPRTAWSLFNGFTEHAKQDNPVTAMNRSIPLHGIFDALVGIGGNHAEQDAEIVIN